MLRTRRTTPSLKKRSSPPAVRPPMYHLSAPSASLKPSLLLSLPRRRAPEGFGIGMPFTAEGERPVVWAFCGVGEDEGVMLAAAAAAAAVADMARGEDDEVGDVDVDDDDAVWAWAWWWLWW